MATCGRDRRARSWCVVTLGFLPLTFGGSIFADIIHVPDDYPTIQQAIDASADGDEVIVADGTYIGPLNKDLDFSGRLITVRSENGPDNCIIDCENSGRGFHFHSAETEAAVVQGLTIQNGKTGDDGGGVYCEDYSSPTIIDCTITGCRAIDNGGGVACHNNSGPALTNCTIVLNDALLDDGGGVYCYHSSPALTECTITGNTTYSGGGGGGVYCGYGSYPTLTGCTITGNTVLMDSGGGVKCEHASPTLIDCVISDNGGDGVSGGGISCSGDSQPILIDCLITDNTAYYSSHGGSGYGGGMACRGGSSSTLIGCVIANNTADSYWCSGYGGGVHCLGASPTFIDCTITANTADSGGGVDCWDSSSPTLADCTITGNTAAVGGAVSAHYLSSPTLSGCTITGNSAGYGSGGVECEEDSNATLTNCILWGDTPPEIGVYSSDPIVTHCDVEGGYAGEGNIDADPLFVDPAEGDYRIAAGSPCIDAGDNTAVPPEITTDLDGNPRFINDPCTQDTGFGDPPIVDMGAYEFQPPCPCDFDCDGDVDTFDLLHLLGAWGTPDGDVDGDGDTDTADLLALLAAWGDCP